MHYYYITGASHGIGKALTELLLEDDNNTVIGISRSQTINHFRYMHIMADLSDAGVLSNISLQHFDDAESVTLVNNAGDIGKIKYIGNNSADAIAHNIQLNLIAPAILCNTFIKSCVSVPVPRVIINISSGAGKSAIDGWATYCASKAGVDLLSNVIALEQKQIQSGIKIFSIAPGVVDTAMQSEIRKADKGNFSRLNDFVDYKENAVLLSPELVAKKLQYVIKNANEFNETVFSLKDVEIN